MTRGRKAFTLPELLVVIATIAIVAMIAFPVMRGAMASAKRVACQSHFRQAHLATDLYLADYDDHFMLVNYHNPLDTGPAQATDKTWVQQLLPYLQEFDIFRCPEDIHHQDRVDATFDVDLVPGDTYDRYYRASLLSNIGYNYLYLSPVVQLGGQWEVKPRTISEIGDPSSMLLYVDTISPRGLNGEAPAGGSDIVMPPCRRDLAGGDTWELPKGTQQFFAPTHGWLSDIDSFERYGRAWPWHLGRTNTISIGGTLKSMTMDQLSRGCDVRENWNGKVKDPGNYSWDMK